MKNVFSIVLILGFLSSCKECGSGKPEPQILLTTDGIYGVNNSFAVRRLAGEDMPAQYGAVCIEIQNPSAFIVRFLDAKKEKDVRMKWEKVEEGKYRISYKDREAFFYDYMKDADPKRPYLIFMMSLKGVKPLESDDDYTNLTKLNNSPTLDDCTTYKREEMNQDPDPGPDN